MSALRSLLEEGGQHLPALRSLHFEPHQACVAKGVFIRGDWSLADKVAFLGEPRSGASSGINFIALDEPTGC
jgi:hypothetical protein